MAQKPFKEKVLRTIAPAYFILLGLYQFALEVIDILTVQHEPGLLLQFSKVRDRAFSRFWTAYGEFMSEGMSEDATNLLRDVRGTVLDVGPGSGDLAIYFNASQLTHVYGVEPAGKLHDKLRANVKRAGLQDKYSVLHCGAQPESLIPALADAGLFAHGAEGIFDEICCMRVLCGVPRPEETVRGLYKLLKPGGKLVVHEHVANPWRQNGSLFARALQTIYGWMGWGLFLGCRLNTPTKDILLKAGGKDGWSKVALMDLEMWSVLPYCTGYLIKKE
ncbi:Methyltransferase type 11 [Macrophomina phaseolina MS6]|uniref:Methyltransferase type 11 n=1 Tax=Macrophomina phaseolina (strain MS6) TaxID=1126212 RepID=K2S5W6_MACPH|nr:Methyltransferase type 11 [Macrophomina phaseolina MS6]